MNHAREAVRLGLLYGALAELVVIALLWPFKVLVWKVCIGQDKRLSTSKTIPFVWTLIFGAMLLALVYAYAVGYHQPLTETERAGVVGQYALLFGGPLGAAILAKLVVNKQTSENPGLKPPSKDGAGVSDLVTDDKGDPELGDLQYVLFNSIALVFVLTTILTEPIKGIPHLPEVLLGLTSISAVGFVGKKALTPSGVELATVTPSEGTDATEVTVQVEGLQPANQPSARFWVSFGADPGAIHEAAVTSGVARITTKPPTPVGVPPKPVPVSIVTADGDALAAGTFTYKEAT